MFDWCLEKKILRCFTDLSSSNRTLLKKAWKLARHLHAGQKRKSGQPYFIHPATVALSLAEKFTDPILTIAGLLHDTVEDCPDCSISEIYEQFGDEVGFLVDAVTKGRRHFYRQGQEFDDHIERLLWAGGQDVRCLLLKIADRQHNISTITHLAKNKQLRMAFETQAIMLPMKLIINYDQAALTIGQADVNWQKFLQQEKLENTNEIKDYLYKRQFVDLDGEMYNLIYGHSEDIIWRLSDEKLFEKLLQDEQFNQTVDILSVASDGHDFRVEFRFNQPYVNVDSSVQLGIAKFSS